LSDSRASGWATYLRVSDEDKQSPERSFAFQRQRIQEQLIARSEEPFYREYRDLLTGTTSKREDYQQMLADAEAGRFSHLGLYRADRFGRDTVEGLQAATRLIGQGVKIRVAHMPSMQPETPDGFFMFLMQMGLAQREVDVLRQRTDDGMEAKLRAGGWPHKAPDGYVNKEELVKSNKYHRWVELDPARSQVIREAWDLLLTGRYTVARICEELTARGHSRRIGKPWAWDDPRTGRRKWAVSPLHKVFHNPFYAGWVVSERFGIRIGEIRGQWEPIVTTEEYERGLEILREHDGQKSRSRRHFYLLRSLLWLEVDDRRYRMYCSTPSGRNQRYAYYLTHAKPNGRKVRVPCAVVDGQVPDWLGGVTVDSDLLPTIRDVYQAEVSEVTQSDQAARMADVERRLAQLRDEEAHLVRLRITGHISQETYDRVRAEWQEKMRHAEARLANLERDASRYIDDLDVALLLLANAHGLYSRLEEKQRAALLQILAKQIIVSPDGEMIGHELHSPFTYLTALVGDLRTRDASGRGSEQIHLGAPIVNYYEPRHQGSFCLSWPL